MLDSIAKDVWVATSPLVFFGLHLGTRMTVVRLSSGELWVHSPTPLARERARIETLGEVRHIVAPNLYHHLFVKEWQTAYPKATLHAPAGIARKRPDLRVDVGLEGAERAPWAKQLVPIHVDGCALDETVFVHPATKTVVSSDLAENFQTSDHWLTRWYLKLSGLHGEIGFSRLLRFLYRDPATARRSLNRLLEHDFDRVIVGHGDIIGTGAKAALRRSYEFLAG